jgi:hypothetical protein
VSWTNAADLTFTGLKFRLNGYRTPPASESLEPGKEGAISRHHLALTLARMMSGRVRSNIAQGSKNPSDPMLLEPRANPVTSNVIGPIDLDVAGPIGEHVGVWSDFCAYGGSDVGIVLSTETTCARPGGYIGVSNLAMRIITNLDGNILGFGGSLLSAVRTHSGGSPYTSYGVYAFLADRLGLTVGVEPGDDNLGFKRFNYRAEGGALPAAQRCGMAASRWDAQGRQRHNAKRGGRARCVGPVEGWFGIRVTVHQSCSPDTV